MKPAFSPRTGSAFSIAGIGGSSRRWLPAGAAWLLSGAALALEGMPAAWCLWGLIAMLGALAWHRSGAAEGPTPAGDVNRELAARLDDAARTWSTHVSTAQTQLRDAVEEMLGAFSDILQQLDGLIGQGDATADQARLAVLAQCDGQLRGLLRHFDGFVQSRNEVLGTVQKPDLVLACLKRCPIGCISGAESADLIHHDIKTLFTLQHTMFSRYLPHLCWRDLWTVPIRVVQNAQDCFDYTWFNTFQICRTQRLQNLDTRKFQQDVSERVDAGMQTCTCYRTSSEYQSHCRCCAASPEHVRRVAHLVCCGGFVV